MKKLREYYERELAMLQGFNQEFAAEYPAQATQLGMTGGTCDDPHIERFIQASALGNARIAQLIDDNDGKLTEALLSVNYPHYLKPFPSAAVVRIDPGKALQAMTAVSTIARGATMSARGDDAAPCRFRSVYDVQLAPVVLSRVAFQAVIDLPPALPRPAQVTSSIRIDIECAGNPDLIQLGLGDLRVYIAGEQSLRVALRDVLFMRGRAAYLELEDGRWIALGSLPIRPVGCAAEESMLPRQANAHPAYTLLTEYFAFPDKFSFFDLTWSQLARHVPAHSRRITLHLGLADVPADTVLARQLAALSASNLLLGCTPVVNLFARSARPIELTHATPDYELMPDATPAHAYDIYSVDRVHALRDTRKGPMLTQFRPYYSLRHGEEAREHGHYYLVRRDPVRAVTHPGHEARIAFTDLDLDPVEIPNASVSIDLTCTNRDRPMQLRHGSPEGDLQLELTSGSHAVRLLHRPTPQYRFDPGQHWRLVSHLALNLCGMVQDGPAALREVLSLYDLRQSAVTRSQIAAIADVQQRPARAWLKDDGHSSIVHGVEIRLTLDEDAFTGASLHLFVQVLDHFFGLYVHLNAFTQLTILARADGKELLRCQPRHGAIGLA